MNTEKMNSGLIFDLLKRLAPGKSNKHVLAVFPLAVLVSGVVIGYWVGHGSAAVRVERDTVTTVQTVVYREPVHSDSVPVKFVARNLPILKHDTILKECYAQESVENIPQSCLTNVSDSAAVVIPIIQKRYEGEGYRAYVSGYEPRLDSIFVFPKTTTIREHTYKPPNKWHIGITGGYGYGFGSSQPEPYIGVGITYSIFSFGF